MRLSSLSFVALLWLGLAGVTVATAQIVSDDFNAYNLKTSIWTLTDPMGDATLTLHGTGTSNATLQLVVPAGASHEIWTEGYNVPRIMQAAPDSDFTLEVKFQSNVTLAYQIQGVVVEQDSANLLRIEFNSAGAGVNIFAASFSGGFSSLISVLVDTALGSLTPPMFLRVHRAASNWTLSYSTDGSIWTALSPFVHAMSVHRVGLFAGNSGGSAAPADTMIVDHFFNTASPINPEDGVAVTDSIPPLIYDVRVFPVPEGLRVTWKTDEPSTSVVDYGKTLSYEGGSRTAPGMVIAHVVTLTGLEGGTLYNVRITSNDFHPDNITTTGNFTGTTFVAPTISVWYGMMQSFGRIGVPQRSADILGNVFTPGLLSSLTYTLNSGAPQTLSVGPDGHLLERAGDFKIELPYADLQSGANEVVITAIDSAGAMTRDTVTVNHHTGAVWPLPYAVSFSGASSLTDSAQVVDGKWERTTGGAHILQTGYEREIAIGDTTWRNYEITAELTVNKIDSTAEAFSPDNGGPAIGFLLRWLGHTDQPTFTPPIAQPLTGYLPLGALGTYHWRKGYGSTEPNRWEIVGNNLILGETNSDSTRAIVYGTKYILKMQVSSLGGTIPFYRLKFWPANQAEPVSWLLSMQQTSNDPQYGSALIVLHYVDATLGRVTVVPLEGDVIPPQIGPITVVPGSHSAYITWATNELSSAMVLYGTTATHGDTVTQSGPASYEHAVQLTGLTPSTEYHFVAVSTDTAQNIAVSNDTAFTTTPPRPPFTFVSDEFNEDSLDTTLWHFVNPPPGDASISKQPTTVSFHVPEGTAHDLWTTGYDVPRIMQSVNNTDFTIEVKLTSPLSAMFQLQGLVVEQDSANVIRFDFNSNGTQTRIFAAAFTNGFGSPVILADSLVSEGSAAPLYMRIKRVDDGWSYQYSLNDTSWTTVATFHHVLTVRKVGIFAGNAGSPPPACDAIIDYIRGTGSAVPIAKARIKVLLEGAYVAGGDSMSTRLTAVLPRKQPYSGAPWYYAGTDSVISLPPSVVDWVLVDLRMDTTGASTAGRHAGFLLNDGTVVDLDGSSPLGFQGVAPGPFYIVVHHRNHLAVMSAGKVPVDSNAVLYDFTTGQNKAYGVNAMKSLGSRFGLFVGDANMDGQVTSLDFDLFNPKFRAAVTGYEVVDWNMDGQVTSLDFDLFNPNFRAAAVCRVPN
jgi:hypothetical protein